MKNIKQFILITAGFLYCLQSVAQKEIFKQSRLITEVQKGKIAAIQKELDAKINVALTKNTKLKAEMEEALKQIASIKDEKLQKEEATRYQDKYLKAYAEVLSVAKVNLSDYAKRMQDILPWFTFSANKKLIITGYARLLAGEEISQPSIPVTRTITGFITNKQTACGLAAGGDVVFTDNSMEATIFAAVAGCCTVNGNMHVSSSLNGAAKATFTVKYKARVNGFAVGVAGAAWVSSKSSGVLQLTDMYNIEVFVLAPVLWAGYDEQTEDRTKTIVKDGFNLFDIDFITSTTACAVLPSETHGSASVKDIEVLLVTQ